MTADAGWRWDHSYARLPELFFVRTHPVPVREPSLVMLNHALAESLGLDATMLARPDAHGIFTGNQIGRFCLASILRQMARVLTFN